MDISLPKQFVSELTHALNQYAVMLNKAAQLSQATSKLTDAPISLYQDTCKRLADSLDGTSEELTDIAMTIDSLVNDDDDQLTPH